MADDELYDKRRGQRALLTKWVKIYNSTDDEGEKERAAHKLADVLAWARTVGMSPAEIAEDRDLPHRALALLEAGGGIASPADDAELREAERDVQSSIDTSGVTRLGAGSGSVYAYGYACAPDRLKIGRTAGDVVGRIVSQINPSTRIVRSSTWSSRPTILARWNVRCTGRWCCANARRTAAARNGFGRPWPRS